MYYKGKHKIDFHLYFCIDFSKVKKLGLLFRSSLFYNNKIGNIANILQRKVDFSWFTYIIFVSEMEDFQL